MKANLHTDEICAYLFLCKELNIGRMFNTVKHRISLVVFRVVQCFDFIIINVYNTISHKY